MKSNLNSSGVKRVNVFIANNVVVGLAMNTITTDASVNNLMSVQ